VRRVTALFAIAMSVLVGVSGCHGVLETTDPTLIRDQDIANAAGANARRLSVEQSFHGYFSLTFKEVALITDEMGYDQRRQYLGPYSNDTYGLDIRDQAQYLATHGGAFDDPHLGNLDWVMTTSSVAIPSIRKYSPDSLKHDFLAQMYAYRGVNIVQMAEDICSGFPINEVTEDNQPVMAAGYTTDSALAYAIAQLDSTIVNVKDSTSYLNLARVYKGRALLDLGKFTEAAAAVADVPDDFTYRSNPNGYNSFVLCQWCDWQGNGFPIGDGEGGNGLHFVSEHDPRSPTHYVQGRIDVSTDSEFTTDKYTNVNDPFIIASGLEKRLILAEAALHDHDASWLTILNSLRATVGLGAQSDFATDSARVDFLYHERAFWLFLTGHRLGDLRRLMRLYGRKADDIYPKGVYPLGGTYHSATSIPFNFNGEALYNFKLTHGCTD